MSAITLGKFKLCNLSIELRVKFFELGHKFMRVYKPGSRGRIALTFSS